MFQSPSPHPEEGPCPRESSSTASVWDAAVQASPFTWDFLDPGCGLGFPEQPLSVPPHTEGVQPHSCPGGAVYPRSLMHKLASVWKSPCISGNPKDKQHARLSLLKLLVPQRHARPPPPPGASGLHNYRTEPAVGPHPNKTWAWARWPGSRLLRQGLEELSHHSEGPTGGGFPAAPTAMWFVPEG